MRTSAAVKPPLLSGARLMRVVGDMDDANAEPPPGHAGRWSGASPDRKVKIPGTRIFISPLFWEHRYEAVGTDSDWRAARSTHVGPTFRKCSVPMRGIRPGDTRFGPHGLTHHSRGEIAWRNVFQPPP